MLASATSLVREWRRREVSALIRLAGSPSAAILGKLLPWILLYGLFTVGYIGWIGGMNGPPPAGSLALWIAAGLVYICSLIACAVLFVSVSPFWVMSIVLGVVYAAPTIPFTGFSYPLEDMDAVAQAFSQVIPLTWFIRLQAGQWITGTPLAQALPMLGKASLFVIVPLAAGIPLLCWRMRRWARSEGLPPENAPAEPAPGFWGTASATLRRAFTNPETLVIFCAGIAFYLFFYGWPYNGELITRVDTAVVDLDRTSESRSLIRDISSSTKVSVKAILSDEGEGKRLLAAQQYDALVLVPREFGSDIRAGRHTSVGVYANGAYPSKGRAVYSGLIGIVQERASRAAVQVMLAHGVPVETLASRELAPPLVITEDRFNTVGGYQSYMVPSVGVLIMQSALLVGITFCIGGALASRRRPGFAAGAIESPARWLAVGLAFFAVSFLWILYGEGFFFSFMSFPTMKNPGATLLMAAAFAAAISAFGLFLSALFGSSHYTAPFIVCTSAPCVFLSGVIYPASGFAPWVHVPALLLPAPAAIRGMVAASQNGASLPGVMPFVLHLTLLAACYGTLSVWLAMRRGRQARAGVCWHDD